MAIWVSLIRVFVTSILLGSFLSPTFFLSLCGALFSLFSLIILKNLNHKYFSLVSLSLIASLAHILGPEIRINSVAPGMIQTRWLKAGMSKEKYENMLEGSRKKLPLQEVATAEDVAETLVWFLEGAKLITGEVLIMDSGVHLGTLPAYSSGDE